MIVFVGLVLLVAFCSIQAVRTARLLHAALWLAGVSAIVALILYLLGATVMAVIELSLSVGVITILLVFAISMVGADSPDLPVSRRFNAPLVAAMLLLVISLTVPVLDQQSVIIESSFTVTFWQQRETDALAQVAPIFAGVLGVLGLLTSSGSVEQSRGRFKVQKLPQPSHETAEVEPQPELEKA